MTVFEASQGKGSSTWNRGGFWVKGVSGKSLFEVHWLEDEFVRFLVKWRVYQSFLEGQDANTIRRKKFINDAKLDLGILNNKKTSNMIRLLTKYKI